MKLKEMIKQIETHTNKKFDLTNKRHFFHLNAKIERLNSNELRKLSLVKQALESNDYEDSIFSSSSHYAKKRYND